jgi:UDPglucose--hexose-1-phosphate uridylyltransferase
MTDSGPQYRTDILTGQQVIVAPQRSHRPSAYPADPPLNPLLDPFAEGQESETPDERFAIRAKDSEPNGPGWMLRVVPNRYPSVVPVLSSESPANAGDPHALFPSRRACGEHDVVIECPDNRSRMAELSPAEIQRTLIAWRTRMLQLMQSPSICSVAIFRNEGFSAGASLAHCHSQILATTELMPLDFARHERATQHRSATGHDLVQDLWNAECAGRIRLIRETACFGVCCPFASRVSWQVRFVPKQSQTLAFSDASDAVLQDLAALIKSTLIALEKTLGGPFSFNLTLSHPRIDQPPAFSWSLDLLPRTGRMAGWELLTSVDIVTVTPETAAEKLRTAMEHMDQAAGP